MRVLSVLLLGLLLVLQGCETEVEKGEFVKIDHNRFYDGQGNQILLHGVNLVNKKANIDKEGFSNPDNYKLMNKWGMNCLRLGVIWAGVEPEPGVYDEAYLKNIDDQIQMAADNGIYVFLDMHQDLYSMLYSDGAPEWATLTEGKEHISVSPVWSDAYFTSPAVKTSITNFWNNKKAADSIGVQDHYVKVWKMLAERYADNTTIIGFDLMNEPNIGWGNIKGQELMVGAFIEAYAQKTGKILSGEEVMGQWLTAEGRSEILDFISDPLIYAKIIDAMYPVYEEFEKEQLMSFYKKTTKAIREVDQEHLIFLETSMSSNMGVYTAIDRIDDEKGLVYAPHGYDLTVDTKDFAVTNNARVDFIFNRHQESSERLQMPLLIGEWGAFGANGDALQSAFQVTRFFERSMCGDTYWHFNKNLENSELLKAISRAYPKSIAGKLLSYSTDVEQGTATFEWKESLNAKNRIFIPRFYNLEKSRIELSPIGEGFELIKTDGGWIIEIPSVSEHRKLVIKSGVDIN